MEVDTSAAQEPPSTSSAQTPTASTSHASPSSSPDFTLHATLIGHSSGVSRLMFSPDGRYLASVGGDGKVHLCDASSGDHLRAFKYRASPSSSSRSSGKRQQQPATVGVNDVAFSACSRYLAAGFDDGFARVWSVKNGTCLRTLRHCSSTASSPVLSIAFSPKGSGVLATGGWDESVILWDLVGRRRVAIEDDDTPPPASSHRSRQAGTEQEETEDGANVALAIRTIAAHSDPISSVGFSADGSMLVTGSWDGLIRLWQVSTGQCLKTLEDEQNEPISHVAFTPNSEYLISSSLSTQTPKVRIWDYTSSRAVKTYSGHKSAKFGGPAVICPCIEPLDPESRSGAAAAASRAYVVSGGEGNEVTVWDLQTREVLQVIDAHAGGVIAVAAHPFEPLIATGGMMDRDKSIKLWKAQATRGATNSAEAAPQVGRVD